MFTHLENTGRLKKALDPYFIGGVISYVLSDHETLCSIRQISILSLEGEPLKYIDYFFF